MRKKDLHKKFYEFAYGFLKDNAQSRARIDEAVIKSYLTAPDPKDNCKNINDVFCRMLFSAQNRQMSSNVIGGSIKGIENLDRVLKNFDVHFVSNKYSNGYDELLKDIMSEFNLKDKIRLEKKSLWPGYCKTIISAADFLSQFSNYNDFLQWINIFYADKKSTLALPVIISEEVFGFGFALACDFLKELGFVNYGKPDIHIKEILSAYGFISKNAPNYSILKKMIEISNDANVTCYDFDKVLWLIGSGTFYNHRNIGKNGFIGHMKAEFIGKANQFSALIHAPTI